MRHKSHLLFVWLTKLVRCRSILDAVEDLHGPYLLCWTTNFFIKRRPIRPSCRDTRTRPIGAYAPPML
jgi:hypothetical protein